MPRKKTLNIEAKLHSMLALSAAHRWLECPGSIYLSTQVPEQESSKYAAEGSKAHEVAEAVLTDVLINNGNLFQSFYDHMMLCTDIEMQTCVLDYCLEVTKIILHNKVQRIAVEKKFILDEELDLGGTADVAFTSTSPAGKKIGFIVDFKYGQGVPVEVEDNPQLIGYACALDSTPDWGPVDRAIVYIYQPRCDHPNGPLRALKLEREDIDRWKVKLLTSGKRAMDQFGLQRPEYKAGEHCQFCPAQAVCLTYAEHMRGAAGFDFLPEVEKPTLPEANMLSEEQIRRLVLNRAEIESFLKRVEEFAMAKALDGSGIVGLKLVHGKGAGRRWAGNVDDIAKALSSRGVSDPYEHKLKGIGAVEAEIGKGKIDDLTVRPEPPLKIVSVDDPREATPTAFSQATSEFSHVILKPEEVLVIDNKKQISSSPDGD